MPVAAEVLPVVATILTKIAPVAAAILTEIAIVVAALLTEFAAVDLSLTEILAVLAAILTQLAAILATFLTEIAAIVATLLTEFLARRFRAVLPVAALLRDGLLRGHRSFEAALRAVGKSLAALDALFLTLLANGLTLLAHLRVRLTLRLTRLAGLLALLHLFRARTAIAALAAILRERCGGDQGGGADQCDQ
ncbi:hypothetical protein ACX0GZ_12430 [Sphingomonas aestuarii]